jgi:hypothetical protein
MAGCNSNLALLLGVDRGKKGYHLGFCSAVMPSECVISNQPTSCELAPQAQPPYPANTSPVPNAPLRRDLPPRAVNSGAFGCVSWVALYAGLLQRLGDPAISGAIRLSVYELIAACAHFADNCALVCLPAKFFVE